VGFEFAALRAGDADPEGAADTATAEHPAKGQRLDETGGVGDEAGSPGDGVRGSEGE